MNPLHTLRVLQLLKKAEQVFFSARLHWKGLVGCDVQTARIKVDRLTSRLSGVCTEFWPYFRLKLGKDSRVSRSLPKLFLMLMWIGLSLAGQCSLMPSVHARRTELQNLSSAIWCPGPQALITDARKPAMMLRCQYLSPAASR